MNLKEKIKNLSKTGLMYALVITGMLQMSGYVLESKKLRGIGFLTAASPLPLVFSHFRGYETFALDFSVQLKTEDGRTFTEKITPQLYAKLKGPYNRRNVFGAAFAYGPGFKEENEMKILLSVMNYGFCREAVVLREFGLPRNIQSISILMKSRTKGDTREWSITSSCDDGFPVISETGDQP